MTTALYAAAITFVIFSPQLLVWLALIGIASELRKIDLTIHDEREDDQ
jgi:hypothetical protein